MDYIIYEEDEVLLEVYKKIIFLIMSSTNLNYHVIVYRTYSDFCHENIFTSGGNRIYLLDLDSLSKNGIDLAMFIRGTGDWNSPIIAITSQKEFKMVGFHEEMLLLKFVSKVGNLELELKERILSVIRLLKENRVLSFHYKGEGYFIPYDDILYIEKQLNDNSSYIVLNDREICIPKSICMLEKELDRSIFIKTHRSCLVNLKKIKHIDYDNRIISVGNKSINLFSRSNKKILKDKFEKYYG